MSIDPSVKDRFIELRAQGLTYDLPTAKLFNLVLRFAGALKNEEADVQHMLDNPCEEETPDPTLEPIPG